MFLRALLQFGKNAVAFLADGVESFFLIGSELRQLIGMKSAATFYFGGQEVDLMLEI